MESIGAVVIKNILSFEKIEKKLKTPETEFLTNGYEKCKTLSEILESKVKDLDDYSSPKIQNSIFKDEK